MATAVLNHRNIGRPSAYKPELGEKIADALSRRCVGAAARNKRRGLPASLKFDSRQRPTRIVAWRDADHDTRVGVALGA
mgnify:CR=1 FL=1